METNLNWKKNYEKKIEVRFNVEMSIFLPEIKHNYEVYFFSYKLHF